MEQQKSSDYSTSMLCKIQAIYDASDKIGSLEKLVLKAPDDARYIAEYLKCNEIHAALFSMIFSLNFTLGKVTLEDLSKHFNSHILYFGDKLIDFDSLVQRKLIRRESLKESENRKSFLQSMQYYIAPELYKTILKKEPVNLIFRHFDDLPTFLDKIMEIIPTHENSSAGYQKMEREVSDIVSKNEHLPFVMMTKAFSLTNESLLILLFLCGNFIKGTASFEAEKLFESIFPDNFAQHNLRLDFVVGHHPLQKKGLVTYEKNSLLSDRSVSLTEKCIDLFFPDGKKIPSRKVEKKLPGLVNFREISKKQLFLGENEHKNLEFLEDVLRPDNFMNLTLRMEDKKMPKGVAILFYGGPGTGKTESVYQMARRTGRDILRVVISDTKSKWFGESEKMIKQVFDQYRSYVDAKETAPILLFNEADGIFSNRKKSNQSSVSQTENAIQNIILQEVEDLQGILVATTNMTENLDKAFERRFLYKICFEKPTPQARFNIWMNKIPYFTEYETKCITDKFELSGGQIDNIARKCLMKEVVHGTPPTLDEVLKFCNEENLQSSVQPIGFKK